MVFKNPWILVLIPVILGLFFFFLKNRETPSFRFPSESIFKNITPSLRMRFHFIPLVIRFCVAILFVTALAGPRAISKETIRKTEGIDIVLTIDASGSMAAEDFKEGNKRKNRLTVVKSVVEDFVQKREDDRLGLVAFSGQAYTVTPLTSDYSWLSENLARIELGMIEDGTAIGSAIMTSISRLRDSDSKEKVIILLTDGVNNELSVDPIEAARVAEAYNIKIYTIGAGVKGYAPFPATDFFGRKVYQKVWFDIDEKSLQKIADITGGEFFRATNTEALRKVYEEIDKLEKTEFEEIGFVEFDELFPFVLMAALLLLAVELFLTNTYFLRIP